MALKGNEEFAASAVSAHLGSLGLSEEFIEGADPPDVVFRPCEGEEWAAEITGLHQYFSHRGGPPTSREAVAAPLRRMCARIKQKTAGRLTQSYVLIAFPPTSISLREMEEQVLQHIESGGPGPWPLGRDGWSRLETRTYKPYRFMSITGLSPEVRTADQGAVGAAIDDNTAFALEKALKDKRARMQPMTSCSRRLLLLVGEYRLASADTVRRALRSLSVSPFDTVLYVEHDGRVSLVAGRDVKRASRDVF